MPCRFSFTCCAAYTPLVRKYRFVRRDARALRPALLPLVSTDELALRDRMLPRFYLYVCHLGAGAEVELAGVEREQLEMIMVDAVSLGGAGAGVARLPAVVGDLDSEPFACVDGACRGRNVVRAPMTEDPARRIGIVDHQREAFRSRGRFTPLQRRRSIRPVAAI